ncbi:23S rRNA (adenine(2503)-C(2))-methyltransferase RlmN [Tepidiforma flava]|uniref:Probable dual-specificity RNA methyltransferase RlmN n=1 Tax=Tepidiforma flava TaxID=3004094 RepID=A0ABY7M741_9CHLR|nr:23S rRNA (adenine(2503)-C(2))-methyltransferase RlmN [Tepidiforma flava]WBL35448.1 23S rRNA (adenine(2503)-C(2))-methyltransferase RlmN [Tepidiforma flava]
MTAPQERESLYGLLPGELETLLAELGAPRYRADQVLHAAYREFAESFEAMRQLPAGLRTALAGRLDLSPAREVRRVASDDGLTTKLLLAMADGTLIETVLMQYPPSKPGGRRRSTVCVSTQAGCAMGCVFCATGQMGFERNLAAGEIVAQAVHVGRLLRERGEHVTNIVFMGMGEPLANYAATVKAVRILTDPRCFGLGQRHITISTVGVIRGIDRLAGEGLQVGLAVSLHAPNDALRRRLVPTAGPHSVREIMAAAKRYFERTGRRVTFEYALIAGENDSDETAGELARLVRGTGAHVNLIPVNPTAGGFRRPARQRVLAFERILREAGVNCTVRVEKGAEISAACGQLRTDEAGRALIAPGEIPVREGASAPARGLLRRRPSPAPSRSR